MISILASCDKVEKGIVDCAGQSLFIDINHTVSSGNALQVILRFFILVAAIRWTIQ